MTLKLLTLCTKNVHFILNNEIYVQNDGVAMDFPLGPILANVFMVELENTLVPRLSQHVKKWRRYVDDPFAYRLHQHVKKWRRYVDDTFAYRLRQHVKKWRRYVDDIFAYRLRHVIYKRRYTLKFYCFR